MILLHIQTFSQMTKSVEFILLEASTLQAKLHNVVRLNAQPFDFRHVQVHVLMRHCQGTVAIGAENLNTVCITINQTKDGNLQGKPKSLEKGSRTNVRIATA